MTNTYAAFGTSAADQPLEPMQIERRLPGPDDVAIDILFCGICHSDLHQAHNDWNNTVYPCVPGHEIVGRVQAVGEEVADYKVGDLVAVGCMVDSCRSCSACDVDLEQYCNKMVATYNGVDRRHGGGITFGGYSKHVVVDKHFVLSVPDTLDPAAASPLLCAGITVWSPLSHWKVGAGMKVGIIGLGGLGHMGVKFARAMGAEVTMITTSPEKGKDAQQLGAHHVLISKDKDAMKSHTGQFDFLLNTIPVRHAIDPYVNLLKIEGTMVLVGVSMIDEFNSAYLAMGRKTVAGSLIGGIKETQEMLDFCGEHNVVSEIEMVNAKDINNAYERVHKNDVKYRFVIDMQSLQDKTVS